jgi:hypothetical protein
MGFIIYELRGGAKVCLSEGVAWRVERNGEERDLSERQQRRWFARLRRENDACRPRNVGAAPS